MWRALFSALLLASTTLAWNQDDQPNVNSRYTVESVHIEGYRSSKVSADLRAEIESIVGQKLDQSLLDRLAIRLRKDLRTDTVSVKVSRGSLPEHVRVEFLVENQRKAAFDVHVPQFSYHSRQGWTGKGAVDTTIAGNQFGFAVLSDGDSEVERFSGVEARFERNLGTSRARLGFEFDSYHQQWNRATQEAFAADPSIPGGLYRVRQNFQPGVTFVIADPLTLNVGVSIQTFDEQLPMEMTRYANAAIASLRYRQQWAVGPRAQSGLDAEYVLRTGTHVLGSDFAFVRNTVEARYELTADKQTLVVSFLGGALTGDAPLFERFVLGNATTLRGWNKYDIAPLGGNRVVHGSVEYRWHWFQVFYDTGTVWDNRTDPELKQSVGFGVRNTNKDGALLLAVAFPLRNGRMDPMFIVGFNF